jgi:hypothetical protein
MTNINQSGAMANRMPHTPAGCGSRKAHGNDRKCPKASNNLIPEMRCVSAMHHNIMFLLNMEITGLLYAVISITYREENTMTIRHPNPLDPSKLESEETQENYPDEVLESEWSPVLEEIHALLPNMPEPRKSRSRVVDAATLRRFQ